MSIKNLNPFFYLLVSFFCLSNTLTANTVISTLIDQPVVVEIAGEYNWASDLDGLTLWAVVDEEDGHLLTGTTTFENGNQLIAFELLEEFDGSVFFLAPESLSGHAGVAMLEISDSEEIEASRYFFLNDSQLYAEETSAELYPEYSSSLRNYTFERIDNERGSIRIVSGNGTDEVILTFSDWESGTWSDSTATGNWHCYDFNSSDVPIEYHSLIEEHTLGHHQDRQKITSHPYEIDSNGYLKVTETTSTQYYNVVTIEDGIIGTIQDDQGLDSVKNDGVNTVDQWFFTTLAAAEEFYNIRVLRRSKEPEPVTLISTPSGQPVVVEIGGNYNWASDLDGVMLWSVEKGLGGWSSSTAKFDNGNLLYAFEFAENVTDSGNNKAPYEIDTNGYIKSLEQDGNYQYYNVVSVENGIIETLEGDQGVESVTENGINEVDQWFFTTRAAAEEFYGDLSGEDWATYDDIGATATVNYPDGYAPDSIDGFNVTVFEDGEILNTIFSDGIRKDSTGDSAPYTYEKTSANEATITLLFENEPSLNPEVTTIKFLSPNNGSFIWREYTDNTFHTVLDQGSGTWQMNAGFERAVDTSIPESSSQYPNGYALESIDGLKVTIWDGSDSETLTFSNGYRYTNEEETTKYIYEKTGANEGEITYPFEDEGGAVEISQITFLSPNHGTFSWTEYSDSTTNTVLDTSSGNWSILPGSVRSNLQEGYYTGGNPTQVSAGEYVLSGSASSASSAVKMPPELLPIIADDPAGNSFLFIDETEDVVGIEGKVMLPSTNAIGSGIYISLWDATPLNSLGIELVKTEDDNASLRFESDDNGYAQDISIPAELDKNYTLRVTHRLGKSSFYIDGEEVGALRTATTPDYWGFGAFNANGLSDYNGTVSDIKILNKYPVADYSSPVLEGASGLSIIEKSNSNDYHWGLDLNGTTLWAYSPDLGHKRFKYEFKQDTVVRSTINQWDDNQTDEEVVLPYSLSADGLLFIQGADHGDEYFNVIGFDEDKKIITANYGSTKLDAAHVDFTDFSLNIALRSGKTRTLEISDNGEDPDSFSITDDLGNNLVDFSSIEDLLDYLEEQDENATFPKSIELINQPVISLLQKYIIDNNKSDNFYADPSIAAGHFMQQAFDKAQLGPLSFDIFKGSTIEKNLPYGKNGKSDYTITVPLSSVDINVSTDLMTEFKNEILTADFNDSALLVVNQFIAKGSPLTDINYDAFTNDNGLSIISISRTYTDSSTGVNLTDYSILIDLNYTHPSDDSYWLSASLSNSNDPFEYTSFHSALSIAQSFDFNQTWNPPSLSLADLEQNSGTIDSAKDAPDFDDSVTVPFQVTDYEAAINWYNSSWFGDFFQSSNGWIFHPHLGWLYPTASSEPESCWMYGENFGWIWLDSYYFPLFFSDVRSNWIYYYRDYTTAPAFWDYQTGGWSKPGESPISVEEVQARDFINYRNWELMMIEKYW